MANFATHHPVTTLSRTHEEVKFAEFAEFHDEFALLMKERRDLESRLRAQRLLRTTAQRIRFTPKKLLACLRDVYL